jgi:pumilio family protein 6
MAQKTQSPSNNPKKRKASSSTSSGTKKDADSSAKSQKRALKQERQSHRKHAEAVIEAKKIWNKLRQKNNSKEEVRQMMEELMNLIRGKAHEIALQHDASRVVQAAIQFGNDEERKEVMTELCKEGNLFELARNQYAHFVVLKAIKYCDKNEDCIKMIVKVRLGDIA